MSRRPRPTLATLATRLGALEQLVRGLDQRHRCRSQDEALLLLVAGAVGDRAFSSTELIRHATVTGGALRGALEAAGIGSAMRLGKLLARSQGMTIGVATLEQVGTDRDGRTWAFTTKVNLVPSKFTESLVKGPDRAA